MNPTFSAVVLALTSIGILRLSDITSEIHWMCLKVRFLLKPGQSTEVGMIRPPVPHLGYYEIYVRCIDGETPEQTAGRIQIKLSETFDLPDSPVVHLAWSSEADPSRIYYVEHPSWTKRANELWCHHRCRR